MRQQRRRTRHLRRGRDGAAQRVWIPEPLPEGRELRQDEKPEVEEAEAVEGEDDLQQVVDVDVHARSRADPRIRVASVVGGGRLPPPTHRDTRPRPPLLLGQTKKTAKFILGVDCNLKLPIASLPLAAPWMEGSPGLGTKAKAVVVGVVAPGQSLLS